MSANNSSDLTAQSPLPVPASAVASAGALTSVTSADSITSVAPDRILAQIVRVLDLSPIPKAEKIELARVLGWQCVVQKSEFQPGQLGVYIGIGTQLPDDEPAFEFLRPKPKEGVANTLANSVANALTNALNTVTGSAVNLRPIPPIKTKRLLGQISQGLLMPVQKFDQLMRLREPLVEGMDVTQLLRLTKHVPKEEMDLWLGTASNATTVSGQPRSIPFPYFVPKTDEERIQNVPRRLQEIVGADVTITTKMDGTSTTYIWFQPEALGLGSTSTSLEASLASLQLESKNSDSGSSGEQADSSSVPQPTTSPSIGPFLICGRNIVLQEREKGNEHYFTIEEWYKIREKLGEYCRGSGQSKDPNKSCQAKSIAIQGEIVGPKINGNRQKLLALEYFVFNVYDIAERRYWSWPEVKKLCAALGLKTVPELYRGPFHHTQAQLLDMADQVQFNGQQAEGLVVKTDTFEPRCSFKVVSNKYLLKHDL